MGRSYGTFMLLARAGQLNFLCPPARFTKPCRSIKLNTYKVKKNLAGTIFYITAVETLGLYSLAISAINLICSGVVPQQPPMMLIKLSSK